MGRGRRFLTAVQTLSLALSSRRVRLENHPLDADVIADVQQLEDLILRFADDVHFDVELNSAE